MTSPTNYSKNEYSRGEGKRSPHFLGRLKFVNPLLKRSYRIILGTSLFLSLLLNVALLWGGYTLWHNPDAADLFCGSYDIASARDQVVYIAGEEGTGSGFWVAPNIVATNNHVVDYNDSIKVTDNQQNERSGTVIATDTVRDLALIHIDGDSGPIVSWRQNPLGVAETVYALGYPGGTGLTITEGIVSAITNDPFDDRTYVQTDSAINPGNSGGILIDGCGRVVGVNTSTLAGSQNIGFAILGEQVQKRVTEMIDSTNKATAEEKFHQAPSDQAEVVAKYYNAISRQEMQDAYNYFSTTRKTKYQYDNWNKGFEDTYFIRFKSVETTSTPNIVKVNFITTDFGETWGEFITKEFSGEWFLVRENGLWKLSDSNIKDVTPPTAEQ